LSITRRRLLALAGASAALPAFPALAQEWPSRSIRMIVGTAPGGSPDIVARLLGEKVAEKLGQSVVVENISQGAGSVAQVTTAKALPDGHTMLMLTAGYPPQMAMRKNPPFDPIQGFEFVTVVCGYPMVYAVAPNSPIASFPDLIARAKADPGKITYTINAQGSIHHILTKWIETEAGIEMTAIPYRGAGPAFTDVIGGRVDVMVEAATSAFPRIEGGQLRLLAVSSNGKYPLMPAAPLVEETLPGVTFMSWLGLAMPGGTPRPIVERMNREVHAALALPDVQKRLAESGNLATPTTPDDMRQRVKTEMERWGRIITAAGIKPE
jgi:tripartite-type tricarboxylate transporter receptor subunit TctC